MKQKNSKAGAICTLLVMIAMAIGIFIGILIGRSMNDNNKQTQDTSAETKGNLPVETQDTTRETEPPADTLAPEDSEAGAVVIEVNGNKVCIEEVNYYLYSMRDEYVAQYGEDPWSQTTDDGQNVAEYAKQQLYDDLVRTQLLKSKAAEYEIIMTDEVRSNCAESAYDIVDTLGPDICNQFGITGAGLTKVYEDGELFTQVYNAVYAKLYEEAGTANPGLSDEALESKALEAKALEAYGTLYAQWLEEADIQTSDIWDSIVVGSVG